MKCLLLVTLLATLATGKEITLLFLSLLTVLIGDKVFRFANYYGDNMVLQRGTAASAIVWGYISTCAKLTATFDQIGLTPSVQKEGNTLTISKY